MPQMEFQSLENVFWFYHISLFDVKTLILCSLCLSDKT